MTTGRPDIKGLILVPSLITLAITILRLVGELQHWNPKLFNPEPGGGGALIGVSWLPPIFGIYFAIKLASSGEYPSSAGRVLGFAALALAVLMGSAFAGFAINRTPGNLIALLTGAVGAIAALVIASKSWPALFKTLLAYGYAARIPIAIIMFVAIYGNWQTHYDVPPSPEFPAMHWTLKWLLIGALPQLLLWIAYTVLTGLLTGGLTMLAYRKKIGKQPLEA